MVAQEGPPVDPNRQSRQSAESPIDRAANRLRRQSTAPPIGRVANRPTPPIDCAANRPRRQSTAPPIDRAANRPRRQSTAPPIGRAANRPTPPIGRAATVRERPTARLRLEVLSLKQLGNDVLDCRRSFQSHRVLFMACRLRGRTHGRAPPRIVTNKRTLNYHIVWMSPFHTHCIW